MSTLFDEDESVVDEPADEAGLDPQEDPQHEAPQQEISSGIPGGVPGEGIYTGISFFEYCTWPVMNNSTLKWADVSMEHLKAAIDGELVIKDTPAKALGRAIHVKLLEPDQYHERYAIAEQCSGHYKSGKKAGEQCTSYGTCRKGAKWYCSKHSPNGAVEPDNIVTAEQNAHIEQIAAKVKSHPVSRLLRLHGGTETCVIWKYGEANINEETVNEETVPVLMKVRLDKWIVGNDENKPPPTIVDIKKVRVGHGTDRRFSYAIRDYDYDVQAAAYIDAVKYHIGREPAWVWVVVEDGYPFGVNVIKADPETIQIGRIKYRGWMEDYIACLESGNWPGYCTDIHEGGLPPEVKRSFKGLIK